MGIKLVTVGRRSKRRLKTHGAGGRKLGRDFERAVGDIFRKFFANAEIQSGVWVEGPDGRRELDVNISQRIDERVFRCIIECKDFDPSTTGPVGIEHIDALESKRRDLCVDTAMLCSNAGFTEMAVRKARRLSIGLIAAVRSGDQRIKFRVMEEIYVRHVSLKSVSLQLCAPPGETLPSNDMVPFDQTVELAATEGAYDWLRRRMRLTPGPEARQMKVVDCNPHVGRWIERPEIIDTWNTKFLAYEADMQMLVLQNELPTNDAPDLDSSVCDEDLDPRIRQLSTDLTESAPGFVIQLPTSAGT